MKGEKIINHILNIQRYDYATGRTETADYWPNGELVEYVGYKSEYRGKAMWLDPIPTPEVKMSSWKKEGKTEK